VWDVNVDSLGGFNDVDAVQDFDFGSVDGNFSHEAGLGSGTREKIHKGGEYPRVPPASTEPHVKKDLGITLMAILFVSAICYALAVTRPSFERSPSQSFSAEDHRVGRPNEKIVMRINGEPVTDLEFDAAFRQLPEEAQHQFASELGKVAFAEQLIRLRLLAGEARRIGLDKDPKIAAQIEADRVNILADAAVQKIVPQAAEQSVKKFYTENKSHFEALDLSHILIAYEGGAVPPRRGGKAPAEQEAMKRAFALHQRLQAGANFASMAQRESDDASSAAQGGRLGVIGPGMLPPEIDRVVFTVATGQVSRPLKSRYGVHLFKINSRAARRLEEVRPAIAQEVRHQDMLKSVETLRRNAKVDFDPKFFPDAKHWRGGKRAS
jgi:hypothetical protein